MLETVGQFELQYHDQAQGTLGSLVATPSVLRRVIDSQGQDTEIVSVKDWVQSATSDEGWTVYELFTIIPISSSYIWMDSRLKGISIESKNILNGVRTKKL